MVDRHSWSQDAVGAVTGASGFIGRALCAALRLRGVTVRALVRGSVGREVSSTFPRRQSDVSEDASSTVATLEIGDISSKTDWAAALDGVDWVIHCAAMAHIPPAKALAAQARIFEVNVAGTRRLAEDAARAGVRRIVFVSSVGVMGRSTPKGRPFDAGGVVAPDGTYARSKWEAELALRQVAQDIGIEIVVVRPPLVYGAGAPGNFQRLLGLIHRGIPLPLRNVDNRRSLVSIESLVDLLLRCVEHPAAIGQTFLVSDNDDLSTADLVRRISWAMGRSLRLWPAPMPLLRTAARLSGQLARMESLVESLQVDIRHTMRALDWKPVCTVDAGLARAVAWYCANHATRL